MDAYNDLPQAFDMINTSQHARRSIALSLINRYKRLNDNQFASKFTILTNLNSTY